jgi:hypothetical protein
LGLTKIPEFNYPELQELMKMAGLDKLVEDKKADNKKEDA